VEILPSFFDALSDAVALVDGHQRVVAANRRYRESFGVREESPAGRPCEHALGCPEMLAGGSPQTCATCQVLVRGQQERRVRTITRLDGTTRRWEGTFTPIRDKLGNVSHVVELWRDLSERTALEAQISHSERLASLGILAAGVGHEINNPLASIMAGLQSLERIFEDGVEERGELEEGREVCALLEREVDRCREITDKLMLLAQPYSSAASWLSLNRAVTDTISLLRFQIRKQGIEVEEVLDPELREIWARDSGIRSVCMNLIMNAVQAMPAGGHLRVSTGEQDGHVMIRVEDTGKGIAPEHLERIWDPFFTTKPPGQGTGLGLSVTERIVKRHEGTIAVENRAEGGARFTVRLPLSQVGRAQP
jgi:PAS domain S-box-containing protein